MWFLANYVQIFLFQRKNSIVCSQTYSRESMSRVWECEGWHRQKIFWQRWLRWFLLLWYVSSAVDQVSSRRVFMIVKTLFFKLLRKMWGRERLLDNWILASDPDDGYNSPWRCAPAILFWQIHGKEIIGEVMEDRPVSNLPQC